MNGVHCQIRTSSIDCRGQLLIQSGCGGFAPNRCQIQ